MSHERITRIFENVRGVNIRFIKTNWCTFIVIKQFTYSTIITHCKANYWFQFGSKEHALRKVLPVAENNLIDEEKKASCKKKYTILWRDTKCQNPIVKWVCDFLYYKNSNTIIFWSTPKQFISLDVRRKEYAMAKVLANIRAQFGKWRIKQKTNHLTAHEYT